MQEGSEIFALEGIEFQSRWFPVFRLVISRPGISVQECSNTLGISHVGVIKLIAELEKANYIVRKKSNTDKRKTEIFLSNQGQKKLKQLERIWDAMESAYISLEENSKLKFLEILNDIEKCLDNNAFRENTIKKLKNVESK